MVSNEVSRDKYLPKSEVWNTLFRTSWWSLASVPMQTIEEMSHCVTLVMSMRYEMRRKKRSVLLAVRHSVRHEILFGMTVGLTVAFEFVLS